MTLSTIVSSRPQARFIADKFRSIVQRNAQILAVELGQVPFPNRSFTPLRIRDEDRLTHQLRLLRLTATSST
jgi:hypothetical protein